MRIVVILCMLLATLPVMAGTFRDDFEDGNLAGWEELIWEDNPVKWIIEDGELSLTFGFNSGGRQLLVDVITDDVTVEFDAIMTETFEHMVGIDCILRTLDADHDIFFNIGRWDNRLASAFCVWWDGKAEIWKEVPFPFEIGKWYHIKGQTQKDEFTFYVDGKKISTHQSTKVAKGKVGFGGGGNGGVIKFDNVVISGPDIPSAGPSGYPVHPKGKLATLWGQLKR